MYLICCVDDRMGMTFGKRRLSRDKQLISDIIALINESGDGRIIMENYSKEIFEGVLTYDRIAFSDRPLDDAEQGEYCFDERFAPMMYVEKIEEIILYRWNRRYPATMYFDIDLNGGCWIKEESKEFCGNSHDNITREIWRKA